MGISQRYGCVVIPPFAATGNLPEGVHETEWDEVVARYGHTPHRLRLLAGLKEGLDALRATGCRRVYIDGSFISAKEMPGDFDACWESDGVDLVQLMVLAPTLFDFSEGRRAQKATFHGEFFPAEAVADLAGRSFIEYFQFDTQTGKPKGIVAVNLGDLP